jgi:broad specificity phosphatase PhoE
MSEKYVHSVEPADDRNTESAEQDPGVPVIDVVRHGHTTYKELTDPNFRFDPGAEGFALDVEHLDLTEEGIASVEETARTMAERIDREHEVILIISSPNFRAQSTALIIGRLLESRGITMLLPYDRVRSTSSLRQITVKEGADVDEWIAADASLREQNPEHAHLPSFERYNAIAARLEIDLSEIYGESEEKIDARFNRFLRHMTNVNDWFQSETKEVLEGKQLRVIAVTHEEVPSVFMQKALGATEHMRNAQVLEVRPRGNLRKDDRNMADLELLAKGEGSQSRTGTIVNQFTKVNEPPASAQ